MACMGAGEATAAIEATADDEMPDGDGVIVDMGTDGGVGAGDRAATDGDSACAVTGDGDSFGGGGVMGKFLPANLPLFGAGAGWTI